ncbi:class F sortase [Pseudonocardia kongjuensis]|uniref:Class F sortase n=1 Tax=Pseudonocardia kongjuensis TaxID=102227 RepID=A0ABN1Y9Z9_9PSEU
MTRSLLTALALVLALTGCTPPPAPAPTPAAPAAAPAPTSVRIPQLPARSTLIRTGMLPDGSPEVPSVEQPMQASWATWSPEPGQPGPAVLYGHVDGIIDGRRGQPGIFADIDELTPGNRIFVDLADGTTVGFVVVAVRSYPKSAFDDPSGPAAREVYGNTTGPQLRLITCGGMFDPAARSYRDQVVVFAGL